MRPAHLRRRAFLENCIVRGLLVSAAPVSGPRLLAAWQQAENQARRPTPREVLGPFFKKGAPDRRDLRVPGEAGFPLRISGKVLNTRGDVVPGATVDVWHADHKGIYDVQGYRYRSKLLVGPPGDYTLETIMPGHYPDRPAQHVHYMIQAPGHKPLITQLYFATDPFFEGDPDRTYGKRGIVSHRESIRPVLLLDDAAANRAAVTFDLILEKA
jgi:catechol 1,2-dioxygenase